MGGRISLTYAGIYSERVERTILNDIGPEIDPRGGNRIATSTRDAVTTFETMDEVIAWHQEQRVGYSALSDAQQQITAGYAVKARPDGGYAWKMDPAVRTDPRRPDPEVSWNLARRISGPVLLVRGGDSDLLSTEIAQRMVADMQDCRMVEVPGVGHAPTPHGTGGFWPGLGILHPDLSGRDLNRCAQATACRCPILPVSPRLTRPIAGINSPRSAQEARPRVP